MQSLKQWPVYLLGRILPAAIGFGAIAVYTRLLDPGSFGTYALLLSMATLIGMTAYSWLRVASLRLIASVSPADETRMITTIAMSFCALSVLVFVVVVGAVRLFAPGAGIAAAVLAGLCAVSSGWFELNIAMLQARLRVVQYGILQLARVCTAFVTSLLLIRSGLRGEALLTGFAVGNFAAFGAIRLWKCVVPGHFSRDFVMQLLRIGWPSSAGAVSVGSNTFQRYMLTTIGGSTAVGIYAAAGDFSQQTVGLLIGTATLAGQPLAFRARDLGTKEQLAEQIRNNARLVFGVGLPAAAGLIVLAGPISDVYLGARFHAGAPVLIAIWAVIIFLAGLRGNYFEQTFEIARDTRAVAINTAVRVGATICLSIWLINAYGSVGAAFAVLASEVIGFALSYVMAIRVMDVPTPWSSWLKTAAATAIMSVAVALVPNKSSIVGLSVAISVGIGAYGATIMLAHLHICRAYVRSFAFARQQSARP